jgi:AcrR family transcriptional regulator/transcriptional regulator with XRE-family HTH domain
VTRPIVASRAVVAARIRDVRRRRGWSARRLATHIGVSAATISAIENGRTGVSTDRLAAIADALSVSPGALLSPAGTPAPGAPALGRPEPSPWRTFDPLDLDPALAGAIAAFVDTGYHGATVRTIAARAGLSVPAVYQRYASKQELLVRVLDLTMDELDAVLSAALAEGTTPLGRLALLVEALGLFHTIRSDLAFIGASEMRSIAPPDRDRIALRRTSIQHLVDAQIAAALRDGTATTTMPSEVGRAIATMCTSLPQWFDLDGPTTPQEIAAEYASLALRMVGSVDVREP